MSSMAEDADSIISNDETRGAAGEGPPEDSGRVLREEQSVSEKSALPRDTEGGQHHLEESHLGPGDDTRIVFSEGAGRTPEESQGYDEPAAKLWSVYVEEAEHHDKALIETWKDDMEGVLIFAGLFSASLTAFLAESYQNLTPDPMQENVYYTRQSVAILSQISAQLAASGSPIPVTVNFPPQYPPFQAAPSDVRVNVYWFMSLVFSLAAALAATIVQQWVRDYMHVFQRYSHPLKRARIRQFLYEGADGWYMSAIVEGVPALIHISLFLFFLGLVDFLFGINTPTAISTTTVIAVCALLYLWTIVAPILNPQSPYQSPLSGVFWYIFQVIRGRRRINHGTGSARTRISTNMTEGRAQLAMQESDARKQRDARAIRWVIDNLTENSELEPFVLGISGSLNSQWGRAVWETVLRGEEDGRIPARATAAPGQAITLPDLSHSITHATANLAHREGTLQDLGSRITRMLKTCTDPGILPTEEARLKRARACIDGVLSLVLSMERNNQWEWFAEADVLTQTLTYLGDTERRVRDPSIVSLFDSMFMVRWMCMSLITMSKVLQTSGVRNAAERVIKCLADVRGEKGGTSDDIAARTAKIIDQCVKNGWGAADNLRVALNREVEPNKAEELFHEIVSENKHDIAELEYTWNSVGWAHDIDEAIITLMRTILHASGGIVEYLPGALLRWQQDSRQMPETGMRATPTYLMPHFIPPRLLVQRLWLCAWALRDIATKGWGVSLSQSKTLGDLCAPELQVPSIKAQLQTTGLMKAQLWRLQDLRDGGLAYTLELFMSAVRSSKATIYHSSRPIFIGTFRHVTSAWIEAHSISVGTQRLLVLLLHEVLSANNDTPADEVPGYIIDEFLTFIGLVLAKKKGSHVDHAVRVIEDYVALSGGMRKVAQETLFVIKSPIRVSVE